MKQTLTFLFLFLKLSTLFAEDGVCGGRDNEGCMGVKYCLEADDNAGCACDENIPCENEEDTCLLGLVDVSLCVLDDGNVADCSEECFLCWEFPVDESNSRFICYCQNDNQCPGDSSCDCPQCEGGICVRETEETSDTNSDSNGCFSERSTCVEQRKGTILVKDLDVGDRVLTRSGAFQTVYTLDHVDSSKQTRFLQIVYKKHNHQSDDDDDDDDHDVDGLLPVLELTPSHMVYVHGKADPVPASQLVVGDNIEIITSPASPYDHDKDPFVIGVGVVQKISQVSRTGLWNPLTTDGSIAIDGVITSTYSAIAFFGNHHNLIQTGPLQQNISIGGFQLASQHNFLHRLMAPFRTLCMGLSPTVFAGEYYEGFNAYSYIGTKALEYFRKRNEVVQGLVLLAVFLSSVLFSVIFSVPGGAAGAIVIFSAAVVYAKRKRS